MTILITLATIAAIGATYVLLPVAISAFAEFRKPLQVTCPVDGEAAQITVDATYAAMTAAVGANRLRLQGCSKWPGRDACNRACLSQMAH